MTPTPNAPPSSLARKLAVAVTIGFSATAACGAAGEAQDARSADVHPLTGPAPTGTDGAGADSLASDAGAPDSGDGGIPICPNGALEDPHRGFVRCLQPGEKSPFSPAAPDGGTGNDGGPGDGGTGNDGGPGAAPSASPTAAPSAAPSAVPSAAPSAAPSVTPEAPKVAGPPPQVEMKAPKFENGDVPKAEKALSGAKVLEAIAKCVADGGGLSAKTGTLKVEFLVRARGKAEGVEVTPKGVSEGAGKCVREFLKGRTMGVPTADPVGVTVLYNLKPAGK